jgi:MFS transporter, DHA1 family, multidrug resistance protein
MTIASVFLGGIVIGGNSAIAYVFTTKSPFIGVELIGLSPAIFGLWRLIPSAGTLCGSFLSTFLSARYSTRSLVWTGMTMMGAGVAITLLAFAFKIVNPWTLFLPMGFALIGLPLTYSAISSSVLSESTNRSTTSASLAFVNLSVTTIAVIVVSTVATKSALFLPVLQIFFVGMMFAVTIIYVSNERKRVQP